MWKMFNSWFLIPDFCPVETWNKQNDVGQLFFVKYTFFINTESIL